MPKNNQLKLNWQLVISTLAMAGLGTISAISSPAVAVPLNHELKLTQSTVKSSITLPVPLNLRPRTHIPLPLSNYSHYSNTRYYHYRRSPKVRHHNYKRYHNRKKIIIITPRNQRSLSNYGNYKYFGNGYIRVISR